jgi:hypothetical protein
MFAYTSTVAQVGLGFRLVMFAVHGKTTNQGGIHRRTSNPMKDCKMDDFIMIMNANTAVLHRALVLVGTAARTRTRTPHS